MFLTPLVLKAAPAGLWVLDRDLVWEDAGSQIRVPRGFITDLASLPPSLQSLLKRNGNSRRAAVLHDFLYRNQPVPRREADAILRRALLAEGVPRRGALIFWAGVRIGGRRAWRQAKERMQ